MFTSLSRRTFVKYGSISVLGLGLAVLGLRRWLPSKKESSFKGGIVGGNSKVGHLIRQGNFAEPSRTEKVDTVIVGGGVAGLSAAWWLNRHGHKDFVLLDLDNELGGNSRSGKNEVSAYPWAAHYVPLPGPEAEYVKLLFEELGIIRRYENKLPVYEESFLCADPHERLFFQGRWHDGVIPQTGIPSADRKQYDEFFALIEKLKAAKGRDGKRAFTVPIEFSSRDKEFTSLDLISMDDFMKSKGWDSKYLNWYVNYCCRDDYGETQAKVSAWAGLHYFASRVGAAANADSQSVVTWPEGNGWLVQKLEAKVFDRVRKNSLVFKIQKPENQNGLVVDYLDVTAHTTVRIVAKNVIYAAPRYTAKHIISESAGSVFARKLSFAPWMVANITLSEKPSGHGQELSWDNVSFYSPSLGYIVATHQDVSRKNLKTVITYYLPLTDEDPALARKSASQKDHAAWRQLILADLEKMHPEISKTVEEINVWIWGHGMVSPGIDYIWHTDREKMQKSNGALHFAHSDMSGISIFEEAQYRGVQAAKKVLENGREQRKST